MYVQRVASTMRGDVHGAERTPTQREVSDEVEHFVANRFVGESERGVEPVSTVAHEGVRQITA